MKNPEDKHELLIEEDVAWVVRKIFCMAADGVSHTEIARQLNGEGMQEMDDSEEITDEELAGLSVLETFDKDRLKALIEKVVVYGEDAIEIVWKV